MGLKIPLRLAGEFTSDIPTAFELQTVGVDDWGAEYLRDSANWIQFAMARHWDRSGVKGIPLGQAQELLNVVPGIVNAKKAFEQSALLGDKLAAISEGSYRVVDTVLSSLGVKVPIIELVARVGIFIQRRFWNKWHRSVMPSPAPVGLRYDRETDQAWRRDALSAISNGSPTSIFLPRVDLDASGGQIDFLRVQDLQEEKERQWLVKPVGPPMGLGAMPAGLGNATAWQGLETAYWDDYLPGSRAASLAAWEMASTSWAHEIQWNRIASAWMKFWNRVQKRATMLNATYKLAGNEEAARQRNVLLKALRPVYPSGHPQVGQQMYGTGNWLGATKAGEGRHMGHVIKDIVQETKSAPTRQTKKQHILIGGLKDVTRRPKRRVSPVVLAGGAAAGLYLLTKVIK